MARLRVTALDLAEYLLPSADERNSLLRLNASKAGLHVIPFVFADVDLQVALRLQKERNPIFKIISTQQYANIPVQCAVDFAWRVDQAPA